MERSEHRRRTRSALTLALALALALAGCGGSGREPAEAAAQPTTPAADPGASPRRVGSRAATAAPLSAANHALYAQSNIACATCHPCGQRSPSGHAASWMDQTSPSFHAVSANAGLSACQTCHGANLDGVGGSTAVSCAQCHGATWKTGCTMCHGGTDNQTGAPPRTIWGKAAETVRVGAHTSHLAATHGLTAPVACNACHLVPAGALSTGHVNGATADLTFGGLATTGGAAPAWNRTAATCSNVYCHGATLNAGGSSTTPTWTTVNGNQVACGTCHGIPPPAPHVASTACGTCHTGYTSTTVNVATHINGRLDVAGGTCTSCHGDATRAATALNPPLPAAPPAGTHGETATTARAVDAHQTHLVGKAVSNGIACTECHVVPTSTSHSNGVVDIAFGTLAKTGGATPAWNTTALGCSATWCHGAKLTGGTLTTPSWTKVDGTQSACGTCHGKPPTSGHHTRVSEHRSASCGACHGGTYTSSAADKSLHLNGKFDVATTIGWNATNRSCNAPSGGCHGGSTKGPW